MSSNPIWPNKFYSPLAITGQSESATWHSLVGPLVASINTTSLSQSFPRERIDAHFTCPPSPATSSYRCHVALFYWSTWVLENAKNERHVTLCHVATSSWWCQHDVIMSFVWLLGTCYLAYCGFATWHPYCYFFHSLTKLWSGITFSYELHFRWFLHLWKDITEIYAMNSFLK